MATATKRRSNVTLARRPPTVPKARYEQLKASTLATRKRAREIAGKRVGTIIGTGTGALAGYLERTGKVSPKYTSPAAFAAGGIVLAFMLPETSMGRGKMGQVSAEAGAGLLAVAGYKLGLGQAVIGEDDVGADDDAVQGEWSQG